MPDLGLALLGNAFMSSITAIKSCPCAGVLNAILYLQHEQIGIIHVIIVCRFGSIGITVIGLTGGQTDTPMVGDPQPQFDDCCAVLTASRMRISLPYDP